MRERKNPYRISSSIAVVLSCFIVSMCGCSGQGDKVTRVEVFGAVTWNGEPLKEGVLRIVPIRGSEGQASGADIRNGRYLVTNKGGVIPGMYQVEVYANRVVDGAVPLDGQTVAYEQFLPEKYNDKSTLSLAVSGEQKKLEYNLTLQE